MVAARCIKCGGENPKEALFCTACGHALHHAQNDPLVGQTVAGRYCLVERIGQGAAGTIYRAEHTTLRRRMAVKLLHQQLAQNDDAVERFRREAITVCEIDNDHIPQVFDFGRAEDGRLFFAMEFLDGQPLSAVLETDGKLLPERTSDILTQIADGLLEAHTLGYVHRDLRPRSVFLTRKRGRADFVKILDFGLAKLVQPDLTDAQRTAMGMTYGDPRYMAPEQARGEVVDRRADIYSLGVLGYEMLCGEPPVKGQGTFDVLSKLLDGPVPRLRDKRPDCPPWLESVIRTALAKKPAERFQTVAQFLDAMERKNVLANQPPLPMQVAKGAKTEAVKKLTPISVSPVTQEAASKNQEVRAFLSQPVMGMVSVSVPADVEVEDLPRVSHMETAQAASDPRAAALAAAVSSEKAAQPMQPQSIKKTLAYPAIKVSSVVTVAKGSDLGAVHRGEVEAAKPTIQKPATKVVEAATGEKAFLQARAPAASKTTQPTEKPAARAGFVNIVATTLERGDPTPRTAAAMVQQESLAWEEAAMPALSTTEVVLQPPAASTERTKLHPSADTPVEEMRFDPQPAHLPVQATTGSIDSGPQKAHADLGAGGSKAVGEAVDAQRTKEPAFAGSGMGPKTQPGLGFGPLSGPDSVSMLEGAAPSSSSPAGVRDESTEENEDATVPDLRTAVKQASENVSVKAAEGAQKKPKLEPETGADDTTPEAADETIRVQKTASEPAAENAKPAESEKTPETPPPEMAHEGDANWFAQSAHATVGDDEEVQSARKQTPKWVLPSLVAAAVVVFGVFWASMGTKPDPGTPPERVASVGNGTGNTPSPGTVPAPVPVVEPLGVEATPKTAPAPSATELVKPTTEPKPEPKIEPKPEPKIEPKIEPKPEPKIEPKPEPKIEPKIEPKPEPKIEPKPEPKAVAKPEPKVVPKPEPKTAVDAKLKPDREKPGREKAEKAEKPADPAVALPEKKPVPSEKEEGKGKGEAAALVALGRQKLDDGEVDAAVASFKRAAQLEPKNVEAVAGLGEASFEQGNFESAAKHLQQAVRLAPRKTPYLELLAQAWFKLGRYDAAAETCRKILKENPGSARAKQTLEQAQKKLDDM